MTSIKDINLIPGGLKNPKKSEDSNRVKQDSVQNKIEPGVNKRQSSVDSVRISSTGKELLRKDVAIRQYVETLKSLEGINENEILEIQKNIIRGVYNEGQVTDKIVDKLYEHIGGSDSFSKRLDASSLSSADTTIDNIQRNIKSGKYDSADIIETIVNKIIEDEL